MIEIDLKPKALKFIKSLPEKHKKQVKKKILSLSESPFPQDSARLVGFDPYLRVDSGEYRIIYRFEEKKELVTIVLVGKRNGDEVYRIARRIL